MDSIVTVLSVAFSLFILMDPIGNIPIYLAVLKEMSPAKQRRVIIRELIIALCIIIFFNFLGEPLLKFLGISAETIMIAGGIILFLIALKMIFPTQKDNHVHDHPHEKEPFIVPLAIPLVAGPAVLASVIIYSGQLLNSWIMVSSIVLAWIASTAILLLSSNLKKLLGWRGITACERLMGLILTLISVEMFLKGMKSYFCPLP